MKLSAVCLLLAVVVTILLVEESSGISYLPYRRYYPYGGRYYTRGLRRKTEKINKGDNDAKGQDSCSFACFLAINLDLSEKEVNDMKSRFDKIDTNSDGSISKAEFGAFNEAQDNAGGDAAAAKRELVDELEKLKSLLKNDDEE